MPQERWREIADDLRARIADGEYPAGTRIPTEDILRTTYGIASNNTLRKAIALLVRDGLLDPRRGAGTFVRDRHPIRIPISGYAAAADPDRPGADRGPWEAACDAAGVDGFTELLAVNRIKAGAALAARLEVTVGAQLVWRRRRMLLGDRVAQVQQTWMPLALVAGTPLDGTSRQKIVGGVYAAMTRAGFPPATTTVEVAARLPTVAEQDEVGVPAGVPVLEIWRTTRDADGRVLEVLHAVAVSDATTLLFDALPMTHAR